MTQSKKIILTGGGTAGHVIPNLALLPLLREEGWEVHYIGSETGIEKRLVLEQGLPFHAIASGKLRRYFDWKNFTDPFRVLRGAWQAWRWLGRIRPAVVFSKGGFVTVPVVLGARLRGIPVILHESDLTPGLANRLCIPFAAVVCASFADTMGHLPAAKAVLTGPPIRDELFHGDAKKGLAYLRLGAGGANKPLLLVIGGSLGSRALNQAVRASLPRLLESFVVAHVCGKGGLDSSLENRDGYRQAEYIGPELPDVLAAADLVLSRAGSNAIFEFLALQKPNLLVPLSKAASRGDQILNAEAFAAQGYSRVVTEENLTEDRLVSELDALRRESEKYRRAMAASPARDGAAHCLIQIRKFS